jgi:hypothetical protein
MLIRPCEATKVRALTQTYAGDEKRHAVLLLRTGYTTDDGGQYPHSRHYQAPSKLHWSLLFPDPSSRRELVLPGRFLIHE